MRFDLRAIIFPLTLALCAALGGGELKIVFTSDLHGHLRNFAALAPAIRAEAGNDGVILDLGDTVSGVFPSEFAENGTGMAEALNRCGVGLWVPGNHDLELPPETFRDFLARFRGRALGADWRKAGRSGEPFVLLEKGGVRCAVIGLTDPRMRQRLLPGEELEVEPPREVLKRVMPRVRASGAQVAVLAWHSGLHSSAGYLGTFLREFPGIDVVLGAHTHQENPGQRVGGALFVQAGAHGHAAGVVEIVTDDRSGRVVGITSRLIRGDPNHPDPELTALERHLENISAGLKDKVLARFSPPLAAPRPGEYGSPFGRLCAEAIRAAAGTDAGLIWLNSPPGPDRDDRMEFTFGKLYRLMPYRNELCALSVTRGELERFIAEQEELTRRRQWRRMLFSSGVRLRRPADGGPPRVECPEKLSVAVNGFALAGSGTLRPLTALPERRFRRIGKSERDIVAAYLAASGGKHNVKSHLPHK